jgi:fructose-specific component phosphotransferase system IIB-like protein
MSRFLTCLFPALVLFTGCMAAKHQPVQAPGDMAVSSAACMGSLDSTEVQAVPASLEAALAALLEERNLQPRPVAADSFLAAFATKRTPQHRLALIADVSSDSELLFLVETTAAYYSQMNGRYRWTVDVDATISPRGDLSEAFSAQFQVPVFLEHYHEKEAAALEASVPLLERRLGALLDAYLGGL